MAKFAKLFEIDEDSQLLVTLEEGEDEDGAPYKVACRTEHNGITLTMSFCFEAYEKQEQCLADFTLEQATEMHGKLLASIKEFSE